MALELSELEGISIVDVDRALAELGAEQNVLDTCTYSETGRAALLEELVRVIDDIGFFEVCVVWGVYMWCVYCVCELSRALYICCV